MKKAKLNQAGDTAVNVGSAVVGGMASNGVVGLVPAKDAKTKTIIRAVLAALAVGGAVMLKGSSKAVKNAKWAFAGMSAEQLRQIVTEYAQTSGLATTPTETSSMGDKFIANVFGLGCPCDSSTYNRPLVQMPALSMPTFNASKHALKNFGIKEGQGQQIAGAFD